MIRNIINSRNKADLCFRKVYNSSCKAYKLKVQQIYTNN